MLFLHAKLFDKVTQTKFLIIIVQCYTPNKKGILSLICGVCFRLKFDWNVIQL